MNRSFNNKVLNEGYGRTYSFRYSGDEYNDANPNSLSLGRFTSSRGNRLMAGINLNYLSSDQTERLQLRLPEILKNRYLRTRARTLRSILPDIFKDAYRTYNIGGMANVKPGVLRFGKPTAVEPAAEPIEPVEPIKPVIEPADVEVDKPTIEPVAKPVDIEPEEPVVEPEEPVEQDPEPEEQEPEEQDEEEEET